MATIYITNNRAIFRNALLTNFHVAIPTANNGVDDKFSLSITVPKSDKRTIEDINQLMEHIRIKNSDMLRGQDNIVPKLSELLTPLKDDDKRASFNPTYKNTFYLVARSKEAPGIVEPDLEAIAPSEIVNGIYGGVSVTFKAYNIDGRRGISAHLDNIQKLRDAITAPVKPTVAEDFGEDFEADDDRSSSFDGFED